MTFPQVPTSLRFLFKSSTQQVSSTVQKEIDTVSVILIGEDVGCLTGTLQLGKALSKS